MNFFLSEKFNLLILSLTLFKCKIFPQALISRASSTATTADTRYTNSARTGMPLNFTNYFNYNWLNSQECLADALQFKLLSRACGVRLTYLLDKHTENCNILTSRTGKTLSSCRVNKLNVLKHNDLLQFNHSNDSNNTQGVYYKLMIISF